jgi:hypothetical protein
MSSQDAASPALVATTTVLATVSFLALARALLYPARPSRIRNPLSEGVYAKSRADETRHLVYQPDQFPGARDVETPVSGPLRPEHRSRYIMTTANTVIQVWKHASL